MCLRSFAADLRFAKASNVPTATKFDISRLWNRQEQTGNVTDLSQEAFTFHYRGHVRLSGNVQLDSANLQHPYGPPALIFG